MPQIIAVKLQKNLFSGFRGEDFLRIVYDDADDDGRKVMTIPHLA